MLVEKFVIQNKTGLHARPASLFVKKRAVLNVALRLKRMKQKLTPKVCYLC